MTTIDSLRVNGKSLSAELAEQITTGELVLSARSVPRFTFTAMDADALTLTASVADLLDESATITWQDYAFRPNSHTTGGAGEFQTVSVEATSDVVRALEEETGGEHWGKTDVSSWARSRLADKATVRVQPNLGERELAREEPPGDHTDPQTTLDVLSEAAKQVGAWWFHNGEEAVVARPSWLVTQPGVRQYRIRWDSWTSHTEALTAPPRRHWDRQAKPYEGRDSLTVVAVDPGEGSTNPLSSARPGDVLLYEGDGADSDDPLWIIVEVRHPLTVADEVEITAWRPIDPPEILDEPEAGSSSGSSAGVPQGPLGAMGWQGEQLSNAAEIVREGQRQGLPTLAMELAVACAMGESSLLNKGYGDAAGPDSVGLFQQRDNWGSRSDRLSPGKAAGFFYKALTAQPYQSNYNNGANALPVSNVGAVYIGPGKSANAASVTIHRVQVNADPYHYARFWSDARLVVRECIAAGKSSGGGGKASGPLGKRIDEIMARLDGQWIDVDGAYGAQCVDLAAKYITELTGIGMVQGNGKDYYNHPGLRSEFQAIAGFSSPRKGDVVAWSGSGGAYANGGYGHVAIYSHSQGGTHYFLSQNPGKSRIMPLQAAGILGVMRPKG